jgi:Arc/MetJ family transcription regulator
MVRRRRGHRATDHRSADLREGVAITAEARIIDPRSCEQNRNNCAALFKSNQLAQPSIEFPRGLCHVMCGGSHMATNLSIDPELIEQALAVSGERTKKAAVTKALQEFIAQRRQKRLLDLMGKLEWDCSYHYKGERARD